MNDSHGLVGHGASGIADLLAAAANSCHPDHRLPEFAWIRQELLLEPDSMPGVLIPAHTAGLSGGYRVLRHLMPAGMSTTETEVGDLGFHSHDAPAVGLAEGDRVFLFWARETPIIVGWVLDEDPLTMRARQAAVQRAASEGTAG